MPDMTRDMTQYDEDLDVLNQLSLIADKADRRIVMLLLALAMASGWAAIACVHHADDCDSSCACTPACCQAALVTTHSITFGCPRLSGSLILHSQKALSNQADPLFRPPQA